MHNTTLIYEMNVVIFSGNNFPDQNVVELSLEIYIITVWNDLQKLTLLVDITVVTTMYFWNMEIVYLYVQHNPLCIVDITLIQLHLYLSFTVIIIDYCRDESSDAPV